MHLPLSTYRIQLSKQFTFAQVEALIPYLKKLGISELYLSPILEAEPGSTHGYNTIDYGHINPELGGMDGLQQLSKTLKQFALGLCIDIVPNHMAATVSNKYWQDVLKNGKSSPYSDLFDIKWDSSTKTDLVYRRFFDINELICLKAEEEKVFNFSHQLILKLIHEHILTSLRIDHLDGLREPFSYLKRLNAAIHRPFYIVAEKILGFNEQLPKTWPLLGTTGYDFLNQLNQVFVNAPGLDALNNYYNHVTFNHKTLLEIKKNCLQLVIQTLFNKEFTRLAEQLQELLGEEVNELLLQCSSLMPIYRIYQQASSCEYNVEVINSIFKQLTLNNGRAITLFKSLLLNHYPDSFTREQQEQWLQWRNDWEVFTGPVMAKGFEDTTCYNYYAFLAVNEVGSAPQYFISGGDINQFHEFNEYKQYDWPYSLNTTSTHDTKRSEDVRARLNVLSELSQEWNTLLEQWMSLNSSKKRAIDHKICPDAVDELLLYQTLIGAWPLSPCANFTERMQGFLVKAMRERKQHSSWFTPDAAYEHATYQFLEQVLADPQFMNTFLNFQKKIAFFGMHNSLSQVLLKVTCPGIPDFYQGTETWCLDLVDPDNRRPVDYDFLPSLESTLPLANLLTTWQDGRIKFNLTQQLLALRNQYKEIFLYGTYQPITIHGGKNKHLIAFIRKYKKDWIAVITCRWFAELLLVEEPWSNAYFTEEYCQLPSDCISLLQGNAFSLTNEVFLVKNLLQELPFNILKNAN